MMKSQTKQDTVWISFYEGLHWHASLLITLLSTVFNTTTNIFKFNTLSIDYFKQHQLFHFNSVDEKPHEHLNKTFKHKIRAPMLTKPFPIKCIIPHKFKGVPPQGFVDEFTRQLCKYSQLISDIKRPLEQTELFHSLVRLSRMNWICATEETVIKRTSLLSSSIDIPFKDRSRVKHMN